MSDFSDRMTASALALLMEYGEAITFTRITQGPYNPLTGGTEGDTTAAFSGYGVPVDYQTLEIDGSIVQQGDVRVYVNATSTEPAVGDQLDLDSRNYRVMNVLRYAISSANVLYELQVRI